MVKFKQIKIGQTLSYYPENKAESEHALIGVVEAVNKKPPFILLKVYSSENKEGVQHKIGLDKMYMLFNNQDLFEEHIPFGQKKLI